MRRTIERNSRKAAAAAAAHLRRLTAGRPQRPSLPTAPDPSIACLILRKPCSRSRACQDSAIPCAEQTRFAAHTPPNPTGPEPPAWPLQLRLDGDGEATLARRGPRAAPGGGVGGRRERPVGAADRPTCWTHHRRQRHCPAAPGAQAAVARAAPGVCLASIVRCQPNGPPMPSAAHAEPSRRPPPAPPPAHVPCSCSCGQARPPASASCPPALRWCWMAGWTRCRPHTWPTKPWSPACRCRRPPSRWGLGAGGVGACG